MGLRMEYLLARLSYQVNRAAGGSMEFGEFIRFYDMDVGGIEDVAQMFGGIKQVVTHGK